MTDQLDLYIVHEGKPARATIEEFERLMAETHQPSEYCLVAAESPTDALALAAAYDAGEVDYDNMQLDGRTIGVIRRQ